MMSDVRGDSTICHQGPNVFNYLDRLSIRVRPGILVVQTVDISHEEKEVGVDHGSCDGRERVVVAKLDLRHCQRVVLVDDGDHTHIE